MKLSILFVAGGLAFAFANAVSAQTPAPKHPQPNTPRTIVVTDAEQPPVILTGQLQATLIVLPAE